MIRRLIRKVFGRGSAPEVRIFPVAQHGIRREQIHPCALKVTRTLRAEGYDAFVVGGAVRDLLLKKTPKDFDVATNATPDQIRALFRRARAIGRRFQIVHVYCGADTIEVTTFRASQDSTGEASEDEGLRQTAADGLILRDNVFGTQTEDAARRDFTVNALYYDPHDETIWDHHNGVADAQKRVLRMIGDAKTRFREDPVRMLRAARFSAKLDFHIDAATRAPIAELAPMLERIPSARIYDEMMKLLLSGHAERGVHQLRAEGLHHGILPILDTVLDDPVHKPFIHAVLHDTDLRVREGRSASPAFMLAGLLWFAFREAWEDLKNEGLPDSAAMYEAMDETLERQRKNLAFPRRLDGTIKEIWSLQPRFEQRNGARPFRLLDHPRWRAGYDFLLLRGHGADASAAELADWWDRFEAADDATRNDLLLPTSGERRPRRRRKRGPVSTANRPSEEHGDE